MGENLSERSLLATVGGH